MSWQADNNIQRFCPQASGMLDSKSAKSAKSVIDPGISSSPL